MNTHITYSFADYLGKIPHVLVFKHLLNTSSALRTIFSSSALHDTVKKYGSSQEVLKRFNTLSPQDQELCAMAYLFDKKGVPHSTISNFETSLLSSFLVYAEKDSNDSWFLVGFDEFSDILMPSLTGIIAKSPCVPMSNIPAESYGASQESVANVVLFLAQCMLGEIKLSKNGKLTKGSETNLIRMLQCKSCSEIALPMLPNMLFEYCYSRQLVTTDDFSISLNIGKTLRWLESDRAQLIHDFSTFLNQHYGCFRSTFLEHLVGTGLQLDILSDYLSDTILPFIQSTGIGLALAGIAHIAINDTCISITFTQQKQASIPLAYPATAIVVMGDFSALIPQETEPKQLFAFLALATVSSFDRVYKAKISREVVFESLALGFLPANMLKTLAQCNSPSNVIATVSEWIREFDRVSLCPDPVIIVSDDRVARQLLAYEPIARHITQIPSQHVFRVNPLRLEYLQQTLQKLGFDPRIPQPLESLNPEDSFDHAETLPMPTSKRVSVTHFAETATQSPARAVGAGKYSTILKPLDIHEMYHVIEYAIVTSERLIIEYTGAANIRKGTYTILPQTIERGVNPTVTASDLHHKWVKQFHLKLIAKIGVGTS